MAPPHSEQSGLTRRRLIGTAAVTGIGAAASGGATAQARTPKRRSRRADVVVVGAGLSGLAAAHDVVAAGRSAIVVEARKRVGGRTLNHPIGGGKIIEAGGEWVGPTQDRVDAKMQELGLTTYPTYIEGNHVYLFEGTRMTYTEDGPTGTAPPDPLIVADIAAATQRLDAMAATVPVAAPWTAPNAAAWDQQTLETWLRANTATERFRDLARLAVRSILGAEPSEMSLLFALFYIAAAGNEQNAGTFERLFSTRNGSNQDRLHGGSQLIALGLAKRLGKRVLLGHPVRQIVQDASGVRVVADGVTVRAKRAIVAIPPALAGRIDYSPLLPPSRDQLMQRIPQGIQIKCEAIYPKPFWRDAGYSGFALTDAGPGQAVFDNSPPDGSPGVLVSFVCGEKARQWTGRPDAELRAAILKQYGELFGPQALQPTGWFQKAWAREEWSRGCPVGVIPPGVLMDNGQALREPVGRIHWAGTETSTYWNGYMDGAIRAGERAAAEALAGG
ncbi:MAG: monoamine oxidase [Solirubrobacteraceae bacterium]|jgi:monoamine oxidase|nr:monoamine oxidase [Solirubrobacteraceae bacterium]